MDDVGARTWVEYELPIVGKWKPLVPDKPALSGEDNATIHSVGPHEFNETVLIREGQFGLGQTRLISMNPEEGTALVTVQADIIFHTAFAAWLKTRTHDRIVKELALPEYTKRTRIPPDDPRAKLRIDNRGVKL